MHKTQIVELKVKDLVPAPWNYKVDGTEAEVAKLAESIKRDNSAGVPAVRELDGKFEVVDGNHRLAAIKLLGWKKCPCENFGEITLAQAVTVARRRNHKWFDDDRVAFAELLRDTVFPEMAPDELETFMPETAEQLENIVGLLDFDWGDESPHSKGHELEGAKVHITLDEETEQMWATWKQRVGEATGDDSNEEAFRLLVSFSDQFNLDED